MNAPPLLSKSIALILVCIFGLVGISTAQQIHTCTIIPTNGTTAASASGQLPSGVFGAVSYKPQRNTYWSAGSTIKVKFIGGSSYLRSRVLHHAREWTKYANVNLQTVTSGSSDIRVAFEQNGASWSMVGKQSAYANANRPTMNFGWLTDRTPEYEIQRTVLHEFGHALGLLHEHQNPAGGIPWDTEAVYRYYQYTQGWSRQMTYDNVMATASKDATQYSAYDRASIMHYPVSAQLTSGRYEVGMNQKLSATDKAYIAMLYPGRRVTDTGTTTTSKPPNKVDPTPSRPHQKGYTIQVSNSLGENQKSETVYLYIADKKYTIHLSKDGTAQKRIAINLPQGRYQYKVVTSSLYFGYRKVRDGNYIKRKYVEQNIEGSGTGVITVDGNQQLTLFGSYDKSRKKMKVYLGETS